MRQTLSCGAIGKQLGATRQAISRACILAGMVPGTRVQKELVDSKSRCLGGCNKTRYSDPFTCLSCRKLELPMCPRCNLRKVRLKMGGICRPCSQRENTNRLYRERKAASERVSVVPDGVPLVEEGEAAS